MEEAVGHFINFIQFSSNPKVALATLQQILPPAIFNIIIQAFAAMAKAQVSHLLVTEYILCFRKKEGQYQ